MNIKNNTLAIPAAPAAIPPKPNIPATMARIIKMTVQRNISVIFKLIIDFCLLLKFHVFKRETLTLNVLFLAL